MNAEDSPAVLVVRFLRSNNYSETLDAFLLESGLPPDTGSAPSKNALTIEQILQEKKVFDVSQAFEKVNLDDKDNAWSIPGIARLIIHQAPSVPTTVNSLPGSSNVLHVAVEPLALGLDGNNNDKSLIVASGADKSVNFVSSVPPYQLESTGMPISESPVLSCAFISSRFCVTSSMSGKIVLHDLKNETVLDERKDHQKYVVKVTCSNDATGEWVASAAWDGRVLVYHLGMLDNGQEEGNGLRLGDPVAEIKLPSNPEAVLFLSHPEIATPVLLVSRRDSTFLYYYALPEGVLSNTSGQAMELDLIGRQNLAPHSNAWVAFTPSAFAISPQDSSILAVATSSVPDMKLLIVRLLLPPPKLGTSGGNEESRYRTQALQSRASLALEDREAAAILIHCSTAAPQTPYSTPALAWRPDATGVFVNGDDGVIRGVETSTGKIVAILKDGHERGSKIRCLWAGWADNSHNEEIVVSGGFDRRLVVWRVEGKTT